LEQILEQLLCRVQRRPRVGPSEAEARVEVGGLGGGGGTTTCSRHVAEGGARALHLDHLDQPVAEEKYGNYMDNPLYAFCDISRRQAE
jgi:hypothetical protein